MRLLYLVAALAQLFAFALMLLVLAVIVVVIVGGRALVWPS